MDPMPSRAPEVSVLYDEIALSSLSRAQLQSLCKGFRLKAGGKNVDLVQRLQEYGQALLKPPTPAEIADESWAILSEPEDDALAAGASAMGEFGLRAESSTGATTISSSSSSNSLASTLRSVSGTILRHFTAASTSKEVPLATARAQDQPPVPSPPRPTSTVNHPSTPSIYPSLSPTSLRSYSASPKPTFAPSICPVESPRSYISGGIRVVNSTGQDDSDESMDSIDPPTTLIAVPKGTTHIGQLARGDSPPPAPSPAFIFGSPAASSSAPTPFSFAFVSTANAPPLATGSQGPSKTAAELVMEEMNRRAAESRGIAPATFTLESMSRTVSMTGPVAGQKGSVFEGAHKRHFDKMDSITNHYAAKRTGLAPSGSPIFPRSGSSGSLHQFNSTSTAPLPSAKRAKLASSSSTSASNALLPNVEKDKRMVASLLGEGWASAAPPQSVSLAASIRSTTGSMRSAAPSTLGASVKGKPPMREGLTFNDGRNEQREERRRKLELAKARRKSQAGGAGTGRRRSTLVGPKPREGNAASRWVKSTYNRLANAAANVPALPTGVASAPISRPAGSTSMSPDLTRSSAPSLSRSTSSRFGLSTAKSAFGGVPRAAVSPTTTKTVSPVVTKKEPGWKKFDLQASLARPLSYTPKLGPIQREGHAVAPRQRPASSISSLASSSIAFGAGPSKRTSSITRSANPARGMSLSQRVANPAMLGPVRGGISSIEASEETVEQSKQAPSAIHEDSVPSFPGSFDFPSVPTTLPFDFPSLPSTLAPLGSTADSAPLLPLTNLSFPTSSSSAPALKKAAPTSARKTRTATKQGPSGFKSSRTERVELESTARKVVARRAAATGMKKAGAV